MSIDRDAIYEQIYAPFAQGTPLLNCGPIAPGPYCNDAFADTYDPAGAETVLTDAGWTKNADGMWADGDGNVPEIRWMVNTGNTRRESTQEFLIPKLAEAGFNVKADNCEALPCVFETRLPSLDYDMAMYINTVAPDPAYLRTWGCDQIPTEENGFQGQNSNGWCNEEATTQLIAADAELDEAKRIEEVQKAISLMAEDHIMLPLLQFPNVGAIRTDRLADAYGELANYRAINDWYQWTDVDGDGDTDRNDRQVMYANFGMRMNLGPQIAATMPLVFTHEGLPIRVAQASRSAERLASRPCSAATSSSGSGASIASARHCRWISSTWPPRAPSRSMCWTSSTASSTCSSWSSARSARWTTYRSPPRRRMRLAAGTVTWILSGLTSHTS